MNKFFKLTAGIVFGLIVFFSVYLYANLQEEEQAQNNSHRAQKAVSPRPQAEEPTVTPMVDLQNPPVEKNLSGGVQMFQTFNNCGPASLSMALSHYGISVSQHELGQALRPYQNPQGDNDDKSVVFEEMAIKAEEYGLLSYHRPAGDMDLIKQFITHDMPVITRTWLEVGEDIGHYRVITGYNDAEQIIIQDDSLQGKQLSFSYDEFRGLWEAFNYEFLVLVPEEKKRHAEEILGDMTDETVAWEKAIDLSNETLSADPDNIYAVFNRSVAQYHLGNYDRAISDFESIEDRLPSRMLWYQIEPILAYYKTGNFDRVFLLTDQIVNNHNRAFSELYYIRAKVNEQNGNMTAFENEMRNAERYNIHFDPSYLAI